jgi:hypothetical protein
MIGRVHVYSYRGFYWVVVSAGLVLTLSLPSQAAIIVPTDAEIMNVSDVPALAENDAVSFDQNDNGSSYSAGSATGISDAPPVGVFFEFAWTGFMPGDANMDGFVNQADAAILAQNWQKQGTWKNGDFNNDGFVNVMDAVLLATNMQKGGGVEPSRSNPEPAAFVVWSVLGFLAGVGYWWRKKRP